MLAYSAELRWFVEGALPAPVEDWFRRRPRCSEAEMRVDEYLLLPGCETVGVKLRSKNFEVKALRVAPCAATIGGVAGLLDGWVKWTLSDPAVTPFAAAMRGDAVLVSVPKTRFLVKYSFDGGAPQPVAAEAHPVEGCNAELTVLECAGRAWWTVAFEAFGAVVSLEDHLVGAAAAFFGAGAAPQRFALDQSCSYPVWLARLAGAPR